MAIKKIAVALESGDRYSVDTQSPGSHDGAPDADVWIYPNVTLKTDLENIALDLLK